MTTGLFIGRFQPFHKGHLSDIKNALKEVDDIIIAIGSSQYSDTKDNPFSLYERMEMVRNTLKNERVSNYSILPVSDIQDDKKWVSHVKSLVPEFKIIFTGNNKTEELFKRAGYEVRKVNMVKDINGTTIRENIIHNKEWQGLIPKGSLEIIKRVKGVERIKDINNKI